MPQIGVVLVIKLVEIQLYIYTEYLHVIYQIYILKKKRAIEDLKNLKIIRVGRTSANSQWPQDSARFKFTQELKTSMYWKTYCVWSPGTLCTSQTLVAKISY